MATQTTEHEVLGEEYEHEPVPLKARRSTFSVSMVWLGFPMIITGAMTGSILVAGMGFKSALMAMVIGNLLKFAYVGALGTLGTVRGLNFALLASATFGRKGLRARIRPALDAAARLVRGADRHHRQPDPHGVRPQLPDDDGNRRGAPMTI